MKIKKCGSISPPRIVIPSKGRYGGLKKFAAMTINRLNGVAIFTRSLGSVGRLKGNWCNYPTGSPNRLGTIQEALEYWKGQKKDPSLLEIRGQ